LIEREVDDMSEELIPREVLFGNPERIAPAISPDGARLAWLAPLDGVLNVWSAPVGSDDPKPLTHDADRGVQGFFWAPAGDHILYVQDQAGDENWRVYDVSLLTGDGRDLTPLSGVQARILNVDKHHPGSIVVGLNQDNPQLHDPYRLDLTTGELTKLAENPGFIQWLIGFDHSVLGGVRPTPDGGMVLMVGRDGSFEPLLEVPPEDYLATGAITASPDNSRYLLITSVGASTARLGWLDLATGKLETVFDDPDADVVQLIVDPDSREVLAAAVMRERLEWHVVDPSVSDDVAAFSALCKGDAVFVGRDHADRTWLLAYTMDDGPIRYYAWDRRARQGRFLFTHRPALEGWSLAPMEPFSFTARDGLTIHGYLTFPPGIGRSGLPTVLDVHGGPWWRDSWGFNLEAQWLANRGYLCVQVNFRGSIGYGKDFVNAADKEWGAKMHLDLLDALDHVIAAGWADPARVGIFGGSYGGYAALVGAAFTPERFACAVALCGPSNLKTFIETIPPYWAPMIPTWHRRVGNPETEEEFLWSRSPLSRADNISIPLLIGHGANDPRVKQSESEQIVAALSAHGIPHEYLLFPDEGHGFVKPENRLRFYAAAERFLGAHLGGRFEPEA